MSAIKEKVKEKVKDKKRKTRGDDSPSPKKHKADVDAKLPETKTSKFDESIAARDPDLLADYFAQAVQRHYGEGSTIEHGDLNIPSRAFLDTTGFDKPHTASNLPAFLEQFHSDGKHQLSSAEKVASPHTLVVTSSGIRVADLNRELRRFNTDDCKVAKFIAKQMKLSQNVDYVKKTKIGIAIGTPARIRDLIQQEALELQNLQRIVIDGSYRDEKNRGIVDMGEIFRPMMELLNLSNIKSKLNEGEVHVMVF